MGLANVRISTDTGELVTVSASSARSHIPCVNGHREVKPPWHCTYVLYLEVSVNETRVGIFKLPPSRPGVILCINRVFLIERMLNKALWPLEFSITEFIERDNPRITNSLASLDTNTESCCTPNKCYFPQRFRVKL